MKLERRGNWEVKVEEVSKDGTQVYCVPYSSSPYGGRGKHPSWYKVRKTPRGEKFIMYRGRRLFFIDEVI